MTKRIVALLIAALFVVSCSMLTACSGKTTTADQKPTESAKPTESVKPTEPPTTAEPTPTPTPTPDPTPSGFEPGEEPNRAEDESAWVEWLLRIYNKDFEYSDTLAELGYPYLETGDPYAGMKAEGCNDPSAWECWGQSYHMCYQFDKPEWDGTANIGTEDYAYAWDIFYRPITTEYEPIGDGKFQKITTAPYSAYVWGGDNPSVIYRVKTYEAGMRLSMAKDADGKDVPQDYELIFLIYYKESKEVVGWNQYYCACTDSTLAYLQEAADAGYVTLDQ